MPLTEVDRAKIAFKPRSTKRQLTVGLLCTVLGFAAVSSVRTASSDNALSSARDSELVQILDDLTQRRIRLEDETQALTSARDALMAGSAEQVIAQTRDRVQALSILAGTVPVYGPGAIIQLRDPLGVLDASTLLDLVEELRDAGAEAVAINSRRVVMNSWFADGRATGIVLSGVLIRAPYVITAIGDSDTMAAALDIPGGIADAVSAAGAHFTISKLQDVTIDTIVQAQKPRYSATTS